MGSAEGTDHQAEEADANLGLARAARFCDRDLSSRLVRLLRHDGQLGFRHWRREAVLRDISALGRYSPTVATLPAASEPRSNKTSKASAPLSTGTFSSTALSYFDPGDSPTTTKLVFFDTEPATLPPRDVMASTAESRVYPSREPVTTIDRPVSVCSRVAFRSFRINQPAVFHLATISRCQGSANQSVIAVTRVGPIPSTLASWSGVALARASMSPNAAATSGATPLPMWRIDNATKNLSSGRVFAASRCATSLGALAHT